MHLNYHLIHLMDFLPVADWTTHRGGLQQFCHLHKLLSDAGERRVRIDIDLKAEHRIASHTIAYHSIP